MRYQHSPVARQQLKEIEFNQKILGMQVINIALLFVAALTIYVITAIWPNFFPYEYLSWNVSLEVLYGFWPLALWGMVIGGFATMVNGAGSSRYDEELLRWSLLTGWIAALWEEIGYRWLFICFGMILIIFFNWLFGTVLGWGLALLFLVLAVAQFLDDKWGLAGLLMIPTVLSVLFAVQAEPLFWFYEVVIMPLLNFLSFGSYSNIIDPALYPPVLVMGAIAANTWFRDGHKYQGIVGYFNSWILGFVFLYAMFTYGLLTAIVLHGLWNTQVAVVDYMAGKFTRLA